MIYPEGDKPLGRSDRNAGHGNTGSGSRSREDQCKRKRHNTELCKIHGPEQTQYNDRLTVEL